MWGWKAAGFRPGAALVVPHRAAFLAVWPAVAPIRGGSADGPPPCRFPDSRLWTSSKRGDAVRRGPGDQNRMKKADNFFSDSFLTGRFSLFLQPLLGQIGINIIFLLSSVG